MKRKIENLSDLKELSREDLVLLVEVLSREIAFSADEFKGAEVPFADTEKFQVNYINSYLNLYHMHDR
jgi:hypothetical protein